MTATEETSLAGAALSALARPDRSNHRVQPLFEDRDELMGCGLAAAFDAGDWCHVFEVMAQVIIDRNRHGLDTLGLSVACPLADYTYDFDKLRGVAWLEEDRVYVRAPYDAEYTKQANGRRSGRWHPEPDVQAWSFLPGPSLFEWLEQWWIVLSDNAEVACKGRNPAPAPPEPMALPPVAIESPASAPPEPPQRPVEMPPPPAAPVLPRLTRQQPEQDHHWVLSGDIPAVPFAGWLKDVPGAKEIGSKDQVWHLHIDPELPALDWVRDGIRHGVQGLEQWLLELEKVEHRREITDSPGFDASRALIPSEGYEVPGLAITLKPFQLAAVEYIDRIAMNNWCLLGDEMGLGKSFTSMAAAEKLGAYPLLVICPSGLCGNWMKEIAKILPHRTAEVCTTRAGAPGICDITVVGYDALGVRLSPFERTKWAGVIIDEAHYIKNPSAARSMNVGIVVNGTLNDDGSRDGGIDGMRIAMTGTFLKNKQLDADHACKVIGREDIAVRIKKDRLNQSAIMRANCMVRRKKADVLPDLPPVESLLVYVDPDPEPWKEYQKAEHDLIEYVKERAAGIAKALGQDADKAAIDAAIKADAAFWLVQMTHLRRLSGLCKKGPALEYAQRFHEQTDRQLIVFAHHLDVIDAIATPLGCDRIDGTVGKGERDEAVERFQVGKQREIVLGFQAGGIGLTLTAASDMLLVEQQWTPADMDQAYGRGYGRLNDVHGLTAVHLAIEGTVDGMLFQLIEDKREMASKTLDDEEYDAIMEQSVMGDLIVGMANL